MTSTLDTMLDGKTPERLPIIEELLVNSFEEWGLEFAKHMLADAGPETQALIDVLGERKADDLLRAGLIVMRKDGTYVWTETL